MVVASEIRQDVVDTERGAVHRCDKIFDVGHNSQVTRGACRILTNSGARVQIAAICPVQPGCSGLLYSYFMQNMEVCEKAGSTLIRAIFGQPDWRRGYDILWLLLLRGLGRGLRLPAYVKK